MIPQAELAPCCFAGEDLLLYQMNKETLNIKEIAEERERPIFTQISD